MAGINYRFGHLDQASVVRRKPYPLRNKALELSGSSVVRFELATVANKKPPAIARG